MGGSVATYPVHRHAAAGLDLSKQMSGDEKSGDPEEDVDADEAPGDERRPQVVEHDEQYGQGPQGLDLGALGEVSIPSPPLRCAVSRPPKGVM